MEKIDEYKLTIANIRKAIKSLKNKDNKKYCSESIQNYDIEEITRFIPKNYIK